jgi:hypothetical protein
MDVLSPEDAGAAVPHLTPVPAHDVTELGRGTDSVAYEADCAPSHVPPALLHSQARPRPLRPGRATDHRRARLGRRGPRRPDFDLAVVGIFFGEDFLARLLAQLPDRDPQAVLDKAGFLTTLRRLTDLAYDIELSPAGREPR